MAENEPSEGEFCRDAIRDSLQAARAQFNDPTFVLDATWFPKATPKELEKATKVCLLAQATDQEPVTRGSKTVAPKHKYTQYTQISVQRLVNPSDTKETDQFVRLQDQIAKFVSDNRNSPAGWTWQGTLATKDENGLPFNFARLRDASVLEVFMTVIHTRVK